MDKVANKFSSFWSQSSNHHCHVPFAEHRSTYVVLEGKNVLYRRSP